MNKKFRQFVLPVLLFAFAGAAQANQQITIGFENQNFFKFDPWEVIRVDSSLPNYNPSGYLAMAEAIDNKWVVTNRFEYSPASFVSASGGLFNLDALFLTGAWGSQTLTITGYKGDAVIQSTSVDVTMQKVEEVFFTGFVGIDRFTIATGSNFVKDPSAPSSGMNWVLGSATVTAVPEPEAYAMLLAGLGLVGAMARCRRKRS
jgi:hypothetical protein